MTSVTSLQDLRSKSGVDLELEHAHLPAISASYLRRPAVSPKPRPFLPFTVVLTLIVLTIVFTLARGKVADPDIWWHLHNAEHLVKNFSLPHHDMYSFTVAGHPWMNHEWLGEIPFYFAWRALGLSGIDALTITLLSLIYLGVLYLAWKRSGNFKAATIATICAVFLGKGSFGPRTILFGYFFLVCLLIILRRFRETRRAAILFLIPPLFCAWINTHGSWSLGMIVFSVTVAGGLFNLGWGWIQSDLWTSQQKKQLLTVWATSIPFLFLNPYGWRLVFYPLDLAFRQKTNVEHIVEWASLNFHDGRGKFVLLVLFLLLIGVFVRPRRWTASEFALLLFGVYCGLTYVRFLCLMGILLAPILAKVLDFVPAYRQEADTPILNTAVALLMIAGVIHYWPTQSRLNDIVRNQYPEGTLAYISAHHIDGPIFNYYLWGGYINWQDPAVKVFIDSRADIFDYTGVFRDYLNAVAIQNSNEILDKYRIRYVLFPHNEPLTYLLEHDARWTRVYGDDNAVLFEKKKPASGVGE
jgi:hypothetical protein